MGGCSRPAGRSSNIWKKRNAGSDRDESLRANPLSLQRCWLCALEKLISRVVGLAWNLYIRPLKSLHFHWDGGKRGLLVLGLDPLGLSWWESMSKHVGATEEREGGGWGEGVLVLVQSFCCSFQPFYCFIKFKSDAIRARLQWENYHRTLRGRINRRDPDNHHQLGSDKQSHVPVWPGCVGTSANF